MSLKRLMLMRQLKTLLLDGKEATAARIAQGIAEDILDSEYPEVRVQDQTLRVQVTSNCGPRIIDEAKRQLKLDTWDDDGSEQQGAA